MKMFETIAVYGVGLLGGSLGLAVKQAGLAGRVIGLGRNLERLEKARRQGAVDIVSNCPEKMIGQDCGLLVVCIPVSRIPDTVVELLPLLPAGAIVTDVGSTKRAIVEAIDRQVQTRDEGPRFIGSHPMAGSEKTGVEHARSDLYEGAACLVTPGKHSPVEAVERLKTFWRQIGCRVLEMPPELHDRLVAVGSHTPHLAATALTLLLGETGGRTPEIFEILGHGFRDTTRIAAGDPVMWRDICLDNTDAVVQSLVRLVEILDQIRQAVEAKDGALIESLLEEGRKIRRQVGDSENFRCRQESQVNP